MPLRRHPRLVEEDAAEVLAIGKDLGLQRQERAARVDEVDAGQAVLERDLLRAQVLLDRERVVGAALDRGVVGDDQHLAARDAADAGDEPGRRAPRRRTGPRRRAARARGTASRGRAAGRCARGPAACPARDAARGTSAPPPCRTVRSRARQLGDEARSCASWFAANSGLRVRRATRGRPWLTAMPGYQPQQSVLKRHAGQRHTACMRYISAPQRSHKRHSSSADAGVARNADSTGVIGGSGASQPCVGL